MQELDDYINRVKHLPPVPRALPKLLTLLGQPNIDTGQIVEVVTFEPSLTAKVLQVCNGVHFSGRLPADNLHEAITRLGFNEVFRIVAAVLGERVLAPPQKGYGIEQGELWKHSVCTAVAAQLIARDRGDDDNVVFTAALLHDLGKLVLASALEGIYAKVIEETEQNQQSLLEAEKKLLGVQHAEIGGRLLHRWQFPASLVAAVWWHHDPVQAKDHQRLAAHVYLANLIAYFIGHGYGHQAFAIRGRAEALDILELTTNDLARFMIKTLEGLEQVKNLLPAAA